MLRDYTPPPDMALELKKNINSSKNINSVITFSIKNYTFWFNNLLNLIKKVKVLSELN